MKEFNIKNCGKDGILVTILSTESTGMYWQELQDALKALHLVDCDVFFDFVYRNGLRNRFFKTHIDSTSSISAHLQKCTSIICCEHEANSFFASHVEILNGSVLTSDQRTAFIQKIRKIK